jgi:hypothetical protein
MRPGGAQRWLSGVGNRLLAAGVEVGVGMSFLAGIEPFLIDSPGTRVHDCRREERTVRLLRLVIFICAERVAL